MNENFLIKSKNIILKADNEMLKDRVDFLEKENERLKEFLYFNFCENKYEPDKLIIEAERALRIFDLLKWRKTLKNTGEENGR